MPTVRGMPEGWRTIISFAEVPDILLYEIEVTPPEIMTGEKIDTTTMRNTLIKTYASPQLIDVGDVTVRVAYDPAVYDDIITYVGTDQLITITFPTTKTVDFYGHIRSFKPDGLKIGERPTAELVIGSVNVEADGDEYLPNYTP